MKLADNIESYLDGFGVLVIHGSLVSVKQNCLVETGLTVTKDEAGEVT